MLHNTSLDSTLMLTQWLSHVLVRAMDSLMVTNKIIINEFLFFISICQPHNIVLIFILLSRVCVYTHIYKF
jgi:hypothetical protein